ncbi:MAG: phosphotransferase [Shimia sp.]|uniref:aminoglycoside phosphotransferase family protein n=1 Tax=Shimia sp. TaxID=1954381 RepID=UPI001B1159CE|nr:phosphotransferase [Shimia sp.]MBO6898528.1 phosphotransferase [Shimia sp.]
MEDQQDVRIDAALQDFLRLQRELGLPDGPVTHDLLWQKKDHRSHIVLRLDCGGKSYVLKRVFGADDFDQLIQIAQAQVDASNAMGNARRMRAPKVHYVSEDGAVLLMDHVTGNTLDTLLYRGRDAKSLLKRSGRWLATFHRVMDRRKRPFRPEQMVAHIDRLSCQIESGSRRVTAPERFLRCASQIPERAAQFADQTTIVARRHGDMNLRNLIFAQDGLYGIDFHPPGYMPVGFDIVRLLLDYAEIHQNNIALKPGTFLCYDVVSSFFEGYRLIEPDDPGFQFLQPVRLLLDWCAIPADPEDRSWRQQDRWQNMEMLIKNGFE